MRLVDGRHDASPVSAGAPPRGLRSTPGSVPCVLDLAAQRCTPTASACMNFSTLRATAVLARLTPGTVGGRRARPPTEEHAGRVVVESFLPFGRIEGNLSGSSSSRPRTNVPAGRWSQPSCASRSSGGRSTLPLRRSARRVPRDEVHPDRARNRRKRVDWTGGAREGVSMGRGSAADALASARSRRDHEGDDLVHDAAPRPGPVCQLLGAAQFEAAP